MHSPSLRTGGITATIEIHEEAEHYVKEKILAEGCRPGKYYPPADATKQEMLRAEGRAPGRPL